MSACRKALLIGICYTGTQSELKGPHGDVDKVKEFLLQKGNFREEDIVVMKDADGIQANLRPYRNNIFTQMDKLVAGPYHLQDSRFFYYSGHGGQSMDYNGDEKDFYDECIFPLDSVPRQQTPTERRPATHRRTTSDSTVSTVLSTSAFSNSGQSSSSSISEPEEAEEEDPSCNIITDDQMFDTLVRPLPKGIRLLALCDSCNSGSVLDLPCQYAINDGGRLKHRGLREFWEDKIQALQEEVEDVEKDMVYLKAGILDRLHYGRLSRSMETALDSAHALLGSAAASLRARNSKGKRRARSLIFDGCDSLRAKKDLLIWCSQKFFSDRRRVEAVENLRRIHGMRDHLERVRDIASEHETTAHVILISGCKDTQLSEESSSAEPTGVLTNKFLEILRNSPPRMTLLQLMSSLREKCKEGDYEQKPQLSSGHALPLHKTPFIL